MATPVTKTMPYTKEAYEAAERWMDESGFEAGAIDIDDLPAVTENLAEAFTRFAESEVKAAVGILSDLKGKDPQDQGGHDDCG